MTSRGVLLSLGLALVSALAAAPGCGHRSSPAEVAQAQPQASAAAVGAPAPEAQLVGVAGDKVALADRLHQHAQTVVVFYRGFWWHSCVVWLGELANHADELAQRDIAIVAIAADSASDTAALQAKVPRVTLLIDPGLAASTAWGVHVPGAENPSPGTFVVGRDGVVQWRRLEDRRGDWPTYAELAAALH